MKGLKVLFILCCLSLLIVGCQGNKNVPNNKEKITVEQSSFRSDNVMTREDIADHLAQVAGNVPDVNDAVAIVAGPYAMVGIDIDKEVERQEAGKIKYTVTEALEHDPYGKQAVVIADADMMERFRMMKKDIQNGASVQGIADELGNIVSRYIPTLPAPEDHEKIEDKLNREK